MVNAKVLILIGVDPKCDFARSILAKDNSEYTVLNRDRYLNDSNSGLSVEQKLLELTKVEMQLANECIIVTDKFKSMDDLAPYFKLAKEFEYIIHNVTMSERPQIVKWSPKKD